MTNERSWDALHKVALALCFGPGLITAIPNWNGNFVDIFGLIALGCFLAMPQAAMLIVFNAVAKRSLRVFCIVTSALALINYCIYFFAAFDASSSSTSVISLLVIQFYLTIAALIAAGVFAWVRSVFSDGA